VVILFSNQNGAKASRDSTQGEANKVCFDLEMK
jgi:hypothetical protein